jgi:hypothetical protein
VHGVLWAEKITYPYGGLAQLVRAPASHAGGHWFESSSLHQKIPDFLRNQEFFFCFFEICILVIVLVKPDQYDDQYGNLAGIYTIHLKNTNLEKFGCP